MVYGPRAGVGTWVTVALTSVVLVAPIVLAIAAPTIAKPSPAPTSGVTVAINTSAPVAHLADQLTALPIVVSNLPDIGSNLAAADYARLTERDPGPAQQMFADAWSGLTYAPGSSEQIDSLGVYLGSRATDAFDEISNQAPRRLADGLPLLTSDPLNADRLNNAGIALFDLGVAWNLAPRPSPEDDSSDSWGSIYEGRALELFKQIADAFPPDRAVLLNGALLTSIVGASPRALALDQKWLAVNPSDLTAITLAASLVARDIAGLSNGMLSGQGGAPDTLRQALALIETAPSSPLTYAAKGDVYLADAYLLADQATYQSRAFANQARISYQMSLSMVRDPGVLAGEASALAFLGERGAALRLQLAAVNAAPDSAPLLLELAAREEAAGDFKSMRSAAQQALSIAIQRQDSVLSATRFGNRGYLGYSFGSDRERTPVYLSIPGKGAGGFSTINGIPAVDDPSIDYFLNTSPEPDTAVLESLRASLLLTDPDTATNDAGYWKQATTFRPGSFDGLWFFRSQLLQTALAGVYLASGRAPSGVGGAVEPGLHFAESNLRYTAVVSAQPRFFAQAAVLCGLAASAQGPFSDAIDIDSVRDSGLFCEGESDCLAGACQAGGVLLKKSYDTSKFPPDGNEAAFAMWRAGETQAANELLITISSSAATTNGASTWLYETEELLGEIALDQRDPHAAVTPFSEALTILADSLKPSGLDLSLRNIAAHAYNNRGIAYLWRAEPSANSPPNCASADNPCELARNDFVKALSIDPSNPLYLENEGWTDQLLNHTSLARVELAAASTADPELYPVRNDLGVIQASLGNFGAAQVDFEAALRTRPTYDLAAWNLGVLYLQRGPSGVLQGESFLALAVRENRAFRADALQHKLDNGIYREAFGQSLQPIATDSTNVFTLGAAVAGIGASFSALLDVINVEIKQKLVELLRLRLSFLLTSGAQTRLRQMGGLLASITGRVPGSLRSWFATGLALGIVTVFSAVLRPSQALLSQIVLALAAVTTALIVHETGQLIAACVAGIGLKPAASPLGIVISLLLVPFGIGAGPYAGHHLLPGYQMSIARWVFLAGPASNLLAGCMAYGLFAIQPLPFLRLLSAVNLAAAAFSLLPFKPLDGAVLSRAREDQSAGFLLLPLFMSLAAAAGGAALRAGFG
jgi:tetratricopeptide (TPR) repeat protein